MSAHVLVVCGEGKFVCLESEKKCAGYVFCYVSEPLGGSVITQQVHVKIIISPDNEIIIIYLI